MRIAPLALRDGEREALVSLTRSSTVMAGAAQRARIVLLAADGVSNTEIAERTGVSRPTVIGWRARYEQSGMAGLVDRPRSGWPRDLNHADIVAATLAPPPAKLGVTHWSSRLLAKHLKISFSAVAKAWREYGVQPWRSETFKFSTDPELVAQVTDVVGLYLDPPENAIVLCVDEKSQIQALDRTPPMLPMQPGLPERRTHDYVRHGTTTLFAALEVATGKVTGICQDRHRHQEFLRFLKHVARGVPQPGTAFGDGQLGRPQTHRYTPMAYRQPAHPRAFHTDVGVLAQPGRSLVRHHRTTGHPPRDLRQRPRTHDGHPHLHHRLEQTIPPVRVDQDRRRNPQKSQPSTNFKHGPLVL